MPPRQSFAAGAGIWQPLTFSVPYHEFLSGSFQEKSNLPAKSPLTGLDKLYVMLSIMRI